MGKPRCATICSTIGAAAVAGFGLSAGRDAWNLFRRNSVGFTISLLAAGAFVGPFWGARELVRGHDRGIGATAVKTVLGSVLAAVAGTTVGGAVIIGIGALFGVTAFGVAELGVLTLLAAGMASGLIVGLIQRPGRKHSFKIARMNAEFLSQHGLTETGGTEITHYDSQGNGLRLIEKHSGRLVFMVVGKRGKRAYVELAPDGRMLAYTGAVTA